MFEGGALNKIGKQTKSDVHSISHNLIVPHAVIDLAYGENFIIAIQVQDPPLDKNSSEVDKFLVDSSNHLFWIIESKKDVVHGPLIESEYLQMRTRTGVPPELLVGQGEFELLREW